jgi:hypothetical protein
MGRMGLWDHHPRVELKLEWSADRVWSVRESSLGWWQQRVAAATEQAVRQRTRMEPDRPESFGFPPLCISTAEGHQRWCSARSIG